MLRPPFSRCCSELVLILILITAEKKNNCHGNQDASCPSQCLCPWSEVHCEALKFSSIPLNLPGRIQTLNMAHNKIRKLTNVSFVNVRNLHRLYLEHNHIQQLGTGVFDGMTLLKELRLHDNNLITLHPQLFHGLFSLLILDLHNNALSFLDKDAFLYNQQLHFLDLQGNRFPDFAELPFHPLNELTHLNLSFNPLNRLEDQTFNGLASLQVLQLVNMSLRSVQPQLLQPVQALMTLNLTGNRLSNLEPEAVDFLYNLRYLSLSDNPFKCDCLTVPFLKWIQNNPILDWDNCCSPRCISPKPHEGSLLTTFEPVNLTCPQPVISMNNHYWTYWTTRSVVNPKPLPYDRMMGWYTATCLSTMLVLFLIFVALDKAKRKFTRWRRAKRLEKENLEKSVNKQAITGDKKWVLKSNSVNSSSTCRSYPIQDALNLATVSRQNSCVSRQNSLIHPQHSCVSRQNSFRSRQNSSSFSRQTSFVSPPSSFTSRQNSNDGDTTVTINYDINRQNDISRPKNPIPKVKIHFAHNLHDFTNFTDPCELLKSQEAKIDILESEMSETRVLLKWPSHTKLNELQEKVETTL